MTWSRATRIFMFVVAAIIGLYDLAAAAFGGAEGTVTLQLWHLTSEDFKKTTLALAIGYFLGHILGRIDK